MILNATIIRTMTMQWLTFVLWYIVVVAATAARKAHSEVYTSYPLDHIRQSPQRVFFSLHDGTGAADRPNWEPQSGDSKTISKRALSVLSRWRPFGNLGVRMNSIHKSPSRGTVKMSLSPGTDFVSAETRDSTRPLGQPLRWGRKR